MNSPLELFSLTYIATAGLYVGMLVYANGLVGSKRVESRILWNSEPILWFLTLLLMAAIVFRLLTPQTQSSGVEYLTGAGNLLVVYIYLILKLARHSLPVNAFWGAVALVVVGNLYVFSNIASDIFASTFGFIAYGEEVRRLLVVMTLILLLVLLFNLAQSLWNSFLKIRLNAPESHDRHSAGGVAVFAENGALNPDGALSEIALEAGAKSQDQQATLPPGAAIVVDFGLRRLEDHGFKSDLRVLRENEKQAVSVEVSNDNKNWVACFQDENIASDWDVPYINSPWRYVRICNTGNDVTHISEVYDLD